MNFEHLVGKRCLMGVQDCFTLAQDFFRDNFDIHITNYARPKDWDADKVNLIELLHQREGFVKIIDYKPADLQPGDVLCLSIGERNPNHFAILVDQGRILHHPSGRLSTCEEYREFWRKCTAFVLRHPNVPNLNPQKEPTDLRSLLSERYRRTTA